MILILILVILKPLNFWGQFDSNISKGTNKVNVIQGCVLITILLSLNLLIKIVAVPIIYKFPCCGRKPTGTITSMMAKGVMPVLCN